MIIDPPWPHGTPYRFPPYGNPWKDKYPDPYVPYEDIYKEIKKSVTIPTSPQIPISEEEIERLEKLIKDAKEANEAAKKAKEEEDFKLLQELAKKFGYKLIKENKVKK